MTLAGFIIAVAVIGVLFYAWYYFVHRNGVYNAAAGNKTNATMKGSNRQRPTNSQAAFGTEVGTIGDQRAPYGQPKQSQLNNTNYEVGSIGDNSPQLQGMQQQQNQEGPLETLGEKIDQFGMGLMGTLFDDNDQQQQQQQQNQGQASAQQQQQAFSSEVGTMGDPNSQSSFVQQVSQLHAKAQQAYQAEVGTIGSSSQGQQQQSQQKQNQNFANSSVQQQARADAQQAFSTEAGSIGDSNQQQGGSASQSQTFASSSAQKQKRQDAQQAFNSEVGSIGDSNKQGSAKQKNAGADMQKYTVEAGQIGELNLIDGQGNTLLPNNIPGTNGMGYFPPQAVSQQPSDDQQK